jgi:glycosyltransferase involved in cell wall biosynthesis
MSTKIATLIAVYGGDDPLLFCSALHSIFDQHFVEAVESRIYLVVDGLVSSEINDVIEECKNGLYRVHRLDKNRGLAAALNMLIQGLEDEEFIFRMDSDDRSHVGRYQSQLDYFRKNLDIDILGTDIVEIDFKSGIRREVSFCRGPKDALDRLCRGVPVAHPTVCFRRAVLDRVVGYPLTGTNEDIALWFRCAQEGFKFDNVRKPLLDFTVGPNFWSRRSIGKAFSELRCYTTGIWSMNGVTWKYVYPMLRFLLRIAPRWFARLIYSSSLRRQSINVN